MVKSQRRTQEERSAATRTRIVGCAIECLNEVGYRGATTPAIMKRVGLSLGALNHHFKDRNELMLAVCEAAYEERASLLALQLKKDAPLESRLHKVATAFWLSMKQPSQRAYLEVLVAAKSDPELLVEVQRYFQRIDYAGQRFWLDAFFDADVSEELLIGLRDELSFIVTGMLLTAPFMLDDGYFEQQIELFCASALLRLNAELGAKRPPHVATAVKPRSRAS